MILLLINQSTCHWSLSLSFVRHWFRHEENMAALETSLRSERQQNDAIMKQLAESRGEIGELQRKLEDAYARNGLLQDSLQRFHSYLKSISSVMSQLPSYPSVKITHHVSELIWISTLSCKSIFLFQEKHFAK